MYVRTIDRQGAIELFESMIQPKSQKRIMFLKGEENMGKSHLLGDVFFTLARQYSAQCITFDLAFPTPTIFDILDNACNILGTHHFRSYYLASQPKHVDSSIVIKNVSLKESSINATNTPDVVDDYERKIRNLTTHFVRDIHKYCNHKFRNKMVVFFVDHMDTNAELVPIFTQKWIMKTFLNQLVNESLIRVVVAGRSLPNLPTEYNSSCESCELMPVEQLREYVTYCEDCGIKYEEETIEAVAILSMHRPGLFVRNLKTLSYYKQRL